MSRSRPVSEKAGKPRKPRKDSVYDGDIYSTVYEPSEGSESKTKSPVKSKESTQEDKSFWDRPSDFDVEEFGTEKSKEEKDADRKKRLQYLANEVRPKKQKEFEKLDGIDEEPDESESESVFLQKIEEVASQTKFWEQQGKGLVGSKIPDTVAQIDRLCICKSLKDPVEIVLSEIFNIVREKIEQTEQEEKRLLSAMQHAPKAQSTVTGISALRSGGSIFPLEAGPQKKLEELKEYKKSKQYQFYQAIEDFRTATKILDKNAAYARLVRLFQIISTPDNKNNPVR